MIGMALAVVAFVVFVGRTETRRLDRAAQHLRELEREGLDDDAFIDQLPEFRAAPRTIVQPDGTVTDARPLLRRELERLRAYPPNRGVPPGRGS